jgi:hypothetical protein
MGEIVEQSVVFRGPFDQTLVPGLFFIIRGILALRIAGGSPREYEGGTRVATSFLQSTRGLKPTANGVSDYFPTFGSTDIIFCFLRPSHKVQP